MKTKIALLMMIAGFMASCKKESTQTVKVEGRYSLELPADMKKSPDPGEDASLQYEDNLRELYVKVIDEPKSNLDQALEASALYDTYTSDLNGYSQLIIDSMDRSVSVDTIAPFTEAKINGRAARVVSFEGVSSGYKIFWKIAFIEGNNRYYQIQTWTKAESHKKNEEEMTAVINSFKDTDKSK